MQHTWIESEKPVESDEWDFNVIFLHDAVNWGQVSGYQAPQYHLQKRKEYFKKLTRIFGSAKSKGKFNGAFYFS